MATFNLNGKRTRSSDEDDVTQYPEQKVSPLFMFKLNSTHGRYQKIFGSALPFRTSPTLKHSTIFSNARKNTPKPLFTQPFTQTITPTDSEDEISPKCAASAPGGPNEKAQSGGGVKKAETYQEDVEMAMGSPQRRCTARDLDLDAMMLSPKPSPFTVLPNDQPPKNFCEASNGGRMPTPIYGHFQTGASTDPISSEHVAHQATLDSDYEKHMRARRLPTPISEDEAMDTFDSPDDDMVDIQTPKLRQPARFPMPSSPTTKRNKPMFSMGFRADCDLCRNRVPGHYNHIFWS